MIVAEAACVNLVEKDISDWYTYLKIFDPVGKTSMLQDIKADRITEVDILAGKVIDFGKTCSIPTHVNEFLYHAIKILDQRASIKKLEI